MKAIETYLDSIGAKETQRVFYEVLAYQLETDIGVCNIQVRPKEKMVFVNFIQFPQRAKTLFGHWKVNMVGSKQDFIVEVKEHFEYILRTITKN